MNARHFDHFIGFWTLLRGFSADRPRPVADARVARAKRTLRRMATKSRAR